MVFFVDTNRCRQTNNNGGGLRSRNVSGASTGTSRSSQAHMASTTPRTSYGSINSQQSHKQQQRQKIVCNINALV